jgi:ribonuclease P/MRP protein subunit RPP1
LACIWGVGSEVGHEAVSKEARRCVGAARLKRSSYRGAVDVVYGGVKPEKSEEGRKDQGQRMGGNKRKAEDDGGGSGGDAATPPLSNRQRKKLAHEARMKAAAEAKAKDAEVNDKREEMDGVVLNKPVSTESEKESNKSSAQS